MGKQLLVFGDGKQTRDLFYVEDCADFIVQAASSKAAVGEIINAGSGTDMSINDLALLVCGNKDKIKHVPHPHPKSEIQRLLCDYSKAKKLLRWKPKVSFVDGLERTKEWIKDYIS